MKVIISESQLNDTKLKRFEKLVNMLVTDTHILNVKEDSDTSFISFSRSYADMDKMKYVGKIQYPFYDEPKELKFGGVKSYSFTVPSRSNLKTFFDLMGIEGYKEESAIWDMYLDKLEQKIAVFIKKYLENEG